MNFNVYPAIKNQQDPRLIQAQHIMSTCQTFEELVLRFSEEYFQITCLSPSENLGGLDHITIFVAQSKKMLATPEADDKLLMIDIPLAELTKGLKFSRLSDGVRRLADAENRVTMDDEFWDKYCNDLKTRIDKYDDAVYAPASSITPMVLSYLTSECEYAVVTITQEIFEIEYHIHSGPRLHCVLLPSNCESIIEDWVHFRDDQLTRLVNNRAKKRLPKTQPDIELYN